MDVKGKSGLAYFRRETLRILSHKIMECFEGGEQPCDYWSYTGGSLCRFCEAICIKN